MSWHCTLTCFDGTRFHPERDTRARKRSLSTFVFVSSQLGCEAVTNTKCYNISRSSTRICGPLLHALPTNRLWSIQTTEMNGEGAVAKLSLCDFNLCVVPKAFTNFCVWKLASLTLVLCIITRPKLRPERRQSVPLPLSVGRAGQHCSAWGGQKFADWFRVGKRLCYQLSASGACGQTAAFNISLMSNCF